MNKAYATALAKKAGMKTGPYKVKPKQKHGMKLMRRFEFGAPPRHKHHGLTSKQKHHLQHDVLEHSTLGARHGNRYGKENILTRSALRKRSALGGKDYENPFGQQAKGGAEGSLKTTLQGDIKKWRKRRRHRYLESKQPPKKQSGGWTQGHSYGPGDSSIT